MERIHSWLSKYRAILVRSDKNSFNDLGLIQLDREARTRSRHGPTVSGDAHRERWRAELFR